MVLNPCNFSIAHRIVIVKRILAKQAREDSLVRKAHFSGLELTLYVEPLRSCPKDLLEMVEDCIDIFLEHRGAYLDLNDLI